MLTSPGSRTLASSVVHRRDLLPTSFRLDLAALAQPSVGFTAIITIGVIWALRASGLFRGGSSLAFFGFTELLTRNTLRSRVVGVLYSADYERESMESVGQLTELTEAGTVAPFTSQYLTRELLRPLKVDYVTYRSLEVDRRLQTNGVLVTDRMDALAMVQRRCELEVTQLRMQTLPRFLAAFSNQPASQLPRWKEAERAVLAQVVLCIPHIERPSFTVTSTPGLGPPASEPLPSSGLP